MRSSPYPAYAYRLHLRPRDIASGIGLCCCLVLAMMLADLLQAPAASAQEAALLQKLAASGYTMVLKDKIADCPQGL